jgi:hypothetical protein
MKINLQAETLSYKNESEWFTRGNFHWKDGIGSNVVFRENFNGLWKIHRGFLEANSRKDITNGWSRFGDRFKPTSTNICITGADTFDHKLKNLNENSSPSNAAFYTYFRHDPFNEDLSDTFVCAYNHRQPTADLMAEDLLKQCVFFGSPAIIENNKPGAMSYFDRNGYGDFIVKVNGKDGIPGSTQNKQSLAEVTEIYVSENCHKVVFPQLLLDWNEFSLEDSTPFDNAMAAGWALLVATRIGKKFQKTPEHFDVQQNLDAKRIAETYRRLL